MQWNAAVELLPLWLAPNMVTLLGFFFVLGNVGLLEIFMPDLVGPVRMEISDLPNPQSDPGEQGPSWLYYSFAFGLWM